MCFKDINTININDSQIGIIAPVYLNDIPVVVKEFILKLSFTDDNTYAFAVLTSGSGKNKNGFKNINIALTQHNVKLTLAYDISMPSSFQKRTDMAPVFNEATQKVVEINEMIKNRSVNYTPHGSIRLPKNFTKLSLIYRLLSRMTVTEKCEGCGLCDKLCPTNNIQIKDNRAVRGKNCIACTACANWCPQYAIKNRMLKGQYHHPDISANDLLPIMK